MGYSGERSNDEAMATLAAISDTVQSIRNSMRVFSLTRDVRDDDRRRHSPQRSPDTFDCCWARPRMWEQYGDKHRGACLLFDKDRLHNAFRQQMPPQNEPHRPTRHMGEVEYTPAGIADSHVVGTISADDTMFANPRVGVARRVARHIDANYHDYYFLKTDDWASEYEYRVVLVSETGDPHAFVEYRNALVAVMVGHLFPPYQVAGAQALCEPQDVALRQMLWYNGAPLAGTPHGVGRDTPG